MAAYLLRETIGGNKFVFLLAFFVSLASLITLLFHTYQTDRKAIIIFFSFIGISVLFELLYGKLYRKAFTTGEKQAVIIKHSLNNDYN